MTEARYVLLGPLDRSYGSFNQLDRAIEYKDALWRLRGLSCEIKDTQDETDSTHVVDSRFPLGNSVSNYQ